MISKRVPASYAVNGCWAVRNSDGEIDVRGKETRALPGSKSRNNSVLM